MVRSTSRDTFSNKKGMYAIVTTIFFVFILIFGAIAFVGISSILGKFQMEADNELMKYNHIQIAKNRILSSSCYTQNPNELDLNQSCNISSNVIRGYKFVMHKFRNCTNESKVWNHRNVSIYQKTFKYMIAIRSNLTGYNCPGNLHIYY